MIVHSPSNLWREGHRRCRIEGDWWIRMSHHNSQMYEYLLEGIGWSRSGSELDRLGVFARAHFTGPLLSGIEVAISNRRAQLDDGRGHPTRHVTDGGFDDFDDLAD